MAGNTLPPVQIAWYAHNAGLSWAQVPTAVAIAMAESGGNAQAHCRNCAGVTEDSQGLWQINLNAHPQYLSANLFDPASNARAMVDVSGRGANWSPWSTYSNGSYRNYLDTATQATLAAQGLPSAPPVNPSDQPLNNPGGLIQGVGQGISDSLAGAIQKSVLQFLEIGIGSLLILSGALILGLMLVRGAAPTAIKVAETAALPAKVAQTARRGSGTPVARSRPAAPTSEPVAMPSGEGVAAKIRANRPLSKPEAQFANSNPEAVRAAMRRAS